MTVNQPKWGVQGPLLTPLGVVVMVSHAGPAASTDYSALSLRKLALETLLLPSAYHDCMPRG